MTVVITSGTTLSLGSGAIMQGGSVPPQNVVYDGVVDQQQSGGFTVGFSLSSFPEGSLMLVCVGVSKSTVISTPSGWNVVTSGSNSQGNSGDGQATRVFSRIKQSGDNSVTVTNSAGTIGGFATSYSNASSASGTSLADSSNNTILSYPAANVNPVPTGSLVVRFGYHDQGGVSSFGSMSGHTQISKHQGDPGYAKVLWHLDSQAGGTVGGSSHSWYQYSNWAIGTTIVINN